VRRLAPAATAQCVPALFPAFVVVAAIACGSTVERGTATVDYRVSDSTGVQIVENVAPAWASSGGWQLAPHPEVSIGFDEAAASGPTDVVGAVRLASGHIVVASAEAVQLEEYDAQGRAIRTIGRRGKGPGEFGAISLLWRTAGDSLLVFEGGMTRQFVLFDSGGRFARAWGAFSADSGMHWLMPIAPLPDGSIAMRAMNVITPSPTVVVERPLSTLGVFDGQWRLQRRLGRFADTKRFRGPGRMLGELFFSPETRFAFGDTAWYAGDSERAEVRAYSTRDALVRIVRWPAKQVRVRPNQIAMEQERRIEEERRIFSNVPRLQRLVIDGGLRPLFQQMPYPERWPEFGELVVDGDANLWALDYPGSGADTTRGRSADVFDPAGRWMGAVRFPPRFRPLDIGRDYVLGVRVDDLDVPRVELYRLTKPDSP